MASPLIASSGTTSNFLLDIAPVAGYDLSVGFTTPDFHLDKTKRSVFVLEVGQVVGNQALA